MTAPPLVRITRAFAGGHSNDAGAALDTVIEVRQLENSASERSRKIRHCDLAAVACVSAGGCVNSRAGIFPEFYRCVDARLAEGRMGAAILSNARGVFGVVGVEVLRLGERRSDFWAYTKTGDGGGM